MRNRCSPRYPLLAVDIGQCSTKVGDLSVERETAHQLIVAHHVAKQQVYAANNGIGGAKNVVGAHTDTRTTTDVVELELRAVGFLGHGQRCGSYG